MITSIVHSFINSWKGWLRLLRDVSEQNRIDKQMIKQKTPPKKKKKT